MNNVTPEQKESVLKSLAILGLLVVIVFIAWVSVQIVSVFPSAVSSLASLANSVYTYNPRNATEVRLHPVAESIETGSEINLSWDKRFDTGTYAFTFLCEDGVSVEIKTTETNFENAECGKSYTLGNVDAASVIVNSEKKGQVPFTYTISYFKTNVFTPSSQSSQSILITNKRFTEPGPNVNVITTPEVPKEPEVVAEVPADTIQTPAPVTPLPQTPTYTYKYIYKVPVSDPKGFTDLKVTYLGIGPKTQTAFINSGTLIEGVEGVLQFSVQNIGTKTSDTWSFSTKLPGDANFTSGTQKALKPNERTVLTITFPAVNKNTIENIEVEVEIEQDRNSKNNSFSWTTIVLDR